MPPTGGSGANTALRDAALLCELLEKQKEGGEWKAEVIGDYERRMREYAGNVVKASCSNAVNGLGVKPLVF